MTLLTNKMKEEISKNYPLYSQDGKQESAICVAKFFIGNYTWYITEGNYEDGDFIMFGIFANGDEHEYGYVSLKEMESVNVKGFEIERDLHFDRQPLKEIKDSSLQNYLSHFYGEDN